jgi:hypothetical protein
VRSGGGCVSIGLPETDFRFGQADQPGAQEPGFQASGRGDRLVLRAAALADPALRARLIGLAEAEIRLWQADRDASPT